MEYTFNSTTTTRRVVSAMDANAIDFQSPFVATGLAGLLAVSFLLFLSYTPKVPKGSPDFISDKYPFVGSYRFFTHKWTFWKEAVKSSKTGSFSFWLGKNHIVGVSGEAARKMYLEHKDLDHIKGIVLIGHGPDYIDGKSTPKHPIWNPISSSGKSYAQRRLLDLQKTEALAKRLPAVTKDARDAFRAVGKGEGIVNPAHLGYAIVCTQAPRIVATDELVDNLELRAKLLKYLFILQCTSSCYLLAFPWLSYFSPSYWKRQYGRWGLKSIISPIVDERLKPNAEKKDDALQAFVDNGESRDYIITFLISMVFISQANGCVLAGTMLYCVAHHPIWQQKIYEEIKAHALTHCKPELRNASLVEQLDSLSVQGWENMSPSLDMCYKECIRMWVAFPMGRVNEGSEDIAIPGTNQVIPAGSLVTYNTIDVHYSEKLYPEPLKWDPERFGPDREEFRKEVHGYMGWGAGRHACNGMRWAKIQQNIILAYALAMYEWTGCLENGEVNSEFRPPTMALNELAPSLPTDLFVKAVART